MLISEIVKLTNKFLPGEHLSYENMVFYLDEVIDEINTKLCSKYPTISEAVELASEDAGEEISVSVINYDYFPNKYIRSVVAKGSAYKFYIQDEEGIITADKYGYEYQDAMFAMERDFLALVPLEYQDEEILASVVKDEYYRSGNIPCSLNVFGE